MEKIAVFPGSFDPITIGHYDVITRLVPLFDKIIVAIGKNSQKKYLFPLEKRLQFIEASFKDYPSVVTDTYTGLTVSYCKKIKAKYLIRGVRSAPDFEFEKTIAQLNKSLWPSIETILLVAQPQHSHISATIVREIIVNNGDAGAFLTPSVAQLIKQDK